MCLSSTAAGMLEAERQFRKIIGHADLAKLALAVERDDVGPPLRSWLRGFVTDLPADGASPS